MTQKVVTLEDRFFKEKLKKRFLSSILYKNFSLVHHTCAKTHGMKGD